MFENFKKLFADKRNVKIMLAVLALLAGIFVLNKSGLYEGLETVIATAPATAPAPAPVIATAPAAPPDGIKKTTSSKKAIQIA
jgi:hypothetical protein